MALEPQQKRIGAHVYKVTPLGGLAGTNMLVRVLKLAGLSASSFVDGTAVAASIEQAIARGMGDALRELMTRLSADETVAILQELANHSVYVLGEREPNLGKNFDVHFAARYDELLGWASFAFEVNFASFFAGPAGAIAMLKNALALAGLQWTSPIPSATGTSTASPPAANTARA